MKRKNRRLQNRLLTGLLYALGFASPLMLVACYAPPTSQLQYVDADEVSDSIDEAAAPGEVDADTANAVNE